MSHKTRTGALTALAISAAVAWSSTASAAIVPADLIAREGDVPAGGDGQPISSLNAPFTDSLGNVGFTGGLLTDLGGTDNFVWYGSGVVWKNSDAPEILTGAEGTMGISDIGGFIYSPSLDGDDSVYTDGGLLAVELEPAVGFDPPATTSFHSRPTMTPDGTAYWIAGVDLDGGGSSDGRVLYQSVGAIPGNITPVIAFGDLVDGLEIEAGSGIDFDYNISDSGNHIHVVLLETGDNNTDGHVYVNGTTVAQELAPSGDGDNWDNFDLVSINDSGDYVFSGDTDGDTGSDEFIAYNASIVVREGDTLDGIPLNTSATVNALSLNNLGQSAFTWNYAEAETVFHACDASDPIGTATALLTTGDEVDFDGDGMGDGTVTDFNASGVVGPGLSLGESGVLYVEIDLDDGVEEVEAVIGLDLPSCGDGPGLEISGRCPGSITIDVSDATPTSSIAILRGSGVGSDVIPAGPCAGTVSGLSGLSLIGIFPTDGGGSFTVTRSLAEAFCGVPLQVLDVTTCTLTDVVNVP